MSKLYRITLIDPTGESDPEVVFEASDRRRIARWVFNWLADPLGLQMIVEEAAEPANVLAAAAK
jgi:hypothetical protein